MQNKKIVLITGATDGIGKATAIGLAKKQFRIVLLARNAVKAEAVKKEIIMISGNNDVDYLLCDLSSQQQVRQLAREFTKKYNHLDVLINNAGVFIPKREVSVDGIEKTLATNYLSHFLLTFLLLDSLKKSKQGRIVNVASKHFGIKLNLNDFQLSKSYSVFGAMGRTKLALVMFTKELSKRLIGTNVTVNSIHPGIVKTPLIKKLPGIIQFFLNLFGISPEKGAENSIFLASEESIKTVSGEFFVNKKIVATSGNANNKADQKLLWEMSEQLTNIIY